MSKRVFLSYRRSDTADQAIALKIVLERKLPEVVVFVDTKSINPGERWPERLTNSLEQSSVIVALIGPHWRFEPDGTDRFTEPQDWVLQEVTHGLAKKATPFIPVLFDTTAKDAFRDLPAGLSGLTSINGLTLSRGDRWVDSANRLALRIATLTGTTSVEATIGFPKPNDLKTRTPRLTEAEFNEHKLNVPALHGWVFSNVPVNTSNGDVEGTELSRSFTFTNFRRAFVFMNRVSELAESRVHHPVWTNSWNRVDVRLRTFDAGHHVTWYDIDMARDMHNIAAAVTAEKKIGWPLRSRR